MVWTAKIVILRENDERKAVFVLRSWRDGAALTAFRACRRAETAGRSRREIILILGIFIIVVALFVGNFAGCKDSVFKI